MLELYFFNVGHGDSIALKFPNGEWGVIDCNKNTNELEPNVLRFLKKHKVQKLAFVCITHPHEDHFYGVDNLIQYYGAENIDKLILYGLRTGSTNEEDKNSSLYKAIRCYVSAIKKNEYKNKIIIANAGLQFNIENVTIDCYNPNDAIRTELQADSFIRTRLAFNKLSIVLLLKYNNTKVLFTGDAEYRVLTNKSDLLCDIVKIPHHGSKHNNTKEVLDSIVKQKVSTSIISAGHLYNLPDMEVVDYLRNVIRTDLYLTSELNVRNNNPAHMKFELSDISKSLLSDIGTIEDASKIENPDGYIKVTISKDQKIETQCIDTIE